MAGLGQIIPINMLVLLRGDELERLACGNATFDVVRACAPGLKLGLKAEMP